MRIFGIRVFRLMFVIRIMAGIHMPINMNFGREMEWNEGNREGRQQHQNESAISGDISSKFQSSLWQHMV